jgi:macrolide transport system ATP-binding/permease protein
MQIPLIAGREFTEADRADSPKVIIVNRKFAQAFGVENAVGRVVAVRQKPIEIVGVVDDALSFALKDDLRPAAYFPYLQSDRPFGAMTFEVRTAGQPMNFAESVTAVVRAADSRLALFDLKTQAAHIDRAISSEITLATLCSTFAVVALLIACVGLYGTVAFNVSRRTNEIGIRMALGASRRRITWMVLRDVLVMALMGFALGIPLVFLGTRYVASFLYGIAPHDPRAIAAAIAVLLVCAMLAGLMPALRASRIAPMGAVRRE